MISRRRAVRWRPLIAPLPCACAHRTRCRLEVAEKLEEEKRQRAARFAELEAQHDARVGALPRKRAVASSHEIVATADRTPANPQRMRRFSLSCVFGLTAAVVLAVGCSARDTNEWATSSHALLTEPMLNEVLFNPPSTDNPYEFIEVKAEPNTSLSGYELLYVEGDSGASLGVVKRVISLAGASTGTSGLLVAKSGTGGHAIPATTAVVVDSAFDTSSGILENGTGTFLLVKGATFTQGTDYDANDDGLLELPAGAVVVDAIGVSDGGANDCVYGPKVVLLAGTPGAVSRFADDTTPNVATAWYGGLITGSLSTDLVYSSSSCSAVMPASAAVTPGADNAAKPASDAGTTTDAAAADAGSSGDATVAVDAGTDAAAASDAVASQDAASSADSAVDATTGPTDYCAQSPCSPLATCTNAANSAFCACNAGYAGDGINCADVNECLTSNGGCDVNAVCTNTAGGRTCACNAGFTGSGTSCADVNECLTSNGGCDVNAVCTNTFGGRTCACNAGFTGNGVTCADVNECLTSNGGCDVNAVCTNTPSGRTCACNAGYAGSGTSCTDVDECLTNRGGCDANAACANTIGGRTCTCNAGYEGSGINCRDVNECATANGGCDANALCTNTSGGRTCACNSGFSGNGESCADVNECLTKNGGCSANATCTNTSGGATCACNKGYGGDGVNCADVDECATNSGGCDVNALCTNTPGARSCTCKWGFTGDGFFCQEEPSSGGGVSCSMQSIGRRTDGAAAALGALVLIAQRRRRRR